MHKCKCKCKYIKCSYSQQESRLRPDSILVMREEEQLISQHFNMKRCSSVFNCNNKYSHSQNQTLTAAFYNIFAVMNYDTAWFLGSDCFLTMSEPLQSPFAIGPFGPLLVHTQVRLLHSHLPKQTTPRGTKNSSAIQPN